MEGSRVHMYGGGGGGGRGYLTSSYRPCLLTGMGVLSLGPVLVAWSYNQGGPSHSNLICCCSGSSMAFEQVHNYNSPWCWCISVKPLTVAQHIKPLHMYSLRIWS